MTEAADTPDDAYPAPWRVERRRQAYSRNTYVYFVVAANGTVVMLDGERVLLERVVAAVNAHGRAEG